MFETEYLSIFQRGKGIFTLPILTSLSPFWLKSPLAQQQGLRTGLVSLWMCDAACY
jgi:hypothetical protein